MNIYQKPIFQSLANENFLLNCQATACNAQLDMCTTGPAAPPLLLQPTINIQDCQFEACISTVAFAFGFLTEDTLITFDCGGAQIFTADVTSVTQDGTCQNGAGVLLQATVDISPPLTDDPCIGTIISWDPDGPGGQPNLCAGIIVPPGEDV